MIRDWIIEKQKVAEKCIQKLEDEIDIKMQSERFLSFSDEEHNKLVQMEKDDLRLNSEFFITLNFCLDVLANIPKEADEYLEQWLREKNVPVAVLYKIIEAYLDVEKCKTKKLWIKGDSERNFSRKIQSKANKIAKNSKKENKGIVPLLHPHSPSMTMKILEDFLENEIYFCLNDDDCDMIRYFVNLPYDQDNSTDGQEYQHLKLRIMQKQSQEKIVKAKELKEQIIDQIRAKHEAERLAYWKQKYPSKKE